VTRQHKTPKQRAQEQLDVAKRAAEKLVRQRNDAQAQLDRLALEAAAAVARRDYLAAHPDLQDTSTTASSTTRNQSGDTA
jgi:hypothetical protein